MTIALGPVNLSGHLVLTGLEGQRRRAARVSRSLFGVARYHKGVLLQGGRSLSLVSQYHITHAQVLEIEALIEAGNPVTLIHPRGTFQVVVVEHDLTPDTDLADPHNDPDLWYSGTISLLTV